MAKRSIVFPGSGELVNIARKAGVPLAVLWEQIGSALAEQPRNFSIAIRGPKRTVTIRLKRDPRTLRKQTFDDEGLGIFRPDIQESNSDCERDEDAGKGSEPTIGSIIDEQNISDMNPAKSRIRTRTPHRLSKAEIPPPRYPIPQEQENRFRTKEMRQRRDLVREKWAKLNRNHNWPSWLVCDDNNHFVAQVVEWKYYPMNSERQTFQAALTLDAINVYFRGHDPSTGSPIFAMSDKAVAKRVERFLKDAARFLEIEARHNEAEAAYDLTEAVELTRSVATPETPQDHLDEGTEDPLVRLWKKRRDDEE
ncbi:MAG TPA: hypothetical protein VFO34_17155 [Candidatus Acidoferrales bacterium]|nr:hypothetical protein [Candidatus Acidoferrales bacterium]